MTDELKAIHAALLAAQGDREAAAIALELDPLKLKETINNNPELRKVWCKPRKARPPTNEDAICRTSVVAEAGLPIVVTEQELRVAAAMGKEDAKFLNDFSKIPGATKERGELAASLQSWHGRNFTKCLDMLTGGLSDAALEVMLRIKRTGRLLDSEEFSGEEGQKRKDMEYRHFVALCDSLVKMTQTAANGSAIRAKVALWKKQSEDGSNKNRGKAGFAPLQAQKTEIHAQPGSTINVTSTEKQKE